MTRPENLNGLLAPNAPAGTAGQRRTAILPSNRAADPAPGTLRRYDISSLGAGKTICHSQISAPADGVFEAAFSAFARGTLIATPNGPCAVEDLQPGDMITTVEQGAAPVVWIGSMTVQPTDKAATGTHRAMTRVMADTFGMSRPLQDTLFGPAARLLYRPAALRDLEDRGQVYVPLRDMVDGGGVISLEPPCPTPLYHLCTTRHATILAAGLEVETYHPGHGLFDGMSRDRVALFLSLFPGVRRLADFGPLAHPRASMATLDSLSAA